MGLYHCKQVVIGPVDHGCAAVVPFAALAAGLPNSTLRKPLGAGLHASVAGIRAHVAPLEEQGCQPVHANDASDLPEGEKGEEGDNDHQHASRQLVDAEGGQIAQPADAAMVAEQSFDQMPEDAEQQNQHAEEDRLG